MNVSVGIGGNLTVSLPHNGGRGLRCTVLDNPSGRTTVVVGRGVFLQDPDVLGRGETPKSV